MLKKRVYKLIIFLIILFAAININVSFENLKGGSFVEIGSKAEAATVTKSTEEYGSTACYGFNTYGQKVTVYTGYYQSNNGFVLTGSTSVDYGSLRNYYIGDSTCVYHIITGIKYSYSKVYNVSSPYQYTQFTNVYDCEKYQWINYLPSVSTDSTLQNSIYSKNKPTMTLSGTLYDPDTGDSESIYYRINGSAGQAGVLLTNLIANNSNQNFSGSINVGGLPEGVQKIYVWAEDIAGAKSEEKCITIKIDQTAPISSAPTLIANSSSQITVVPNATDPVANGVNSGVSSFPYIYGKLASSTGSYQVIAWGKSTNYVAAGLKPNTRYSYFYDARDIALNASGSPASSKYTLAETPTVSVGTLTPTTMDLVISDANPNDTVYLIMVKSGSSIRYVMTNGQMSTDSCYTTLSNKKITVAVPSNYVQPLTVTAKAVNGDGILTNVSSSVSVVLPPPELSEVFVKEKTTDSIRISWDQVPRATSYDINVNSSNTYNVATNSYSITGLSAGTNNLIMVRARIGNVTGGWYRTTEYTLPSAPTGFAATLFLDSVDLSWDRVGTSNYEISIDDDYPTITRGTLITYGFTDFNNIHSFKVRAVNGDGEYGEYSDAITMYSPANIPKYCSADHYGSDWIVVTWKNNGNSNITQYSLAAFDERGVLVKQNEWSQATGDIITGLSADTTYIFKVKARNEDGIETEWSSATKAKTSPNPPSIPSGVTVTTVSNSKIKITWYNQTGATYDIERNGVLIAQDLTAASYEDSGLAPETAYKYSIQAKNAGGSSGFSSEISQATYPNVPSVPTGINSTVTTNSVKLTWSAVDKVTGYKIDNGSSQTDVGNVKEYTFNNLETGARYSYRILAYNRGGDGSSTSEYTVYTLINTPSEVTASSSNNRVLVSWTSVPEATGYEVCLNNSKEITTSTSISFEGLTPSTAYTYKVRSVNSRTGSEWSSQGTKTTLPNIPNTPSGIAFSSTRTTTAVSWSGVSDATSYDIMMDSELILGIYDMNYTVTGLNPGSSHKYKVRARNAGGKSGWSDSITAGTMAMEPNVPANLKANEDNDCITILWDAVSGAEGYEVEISSNTTSSAIIMVNGLKYEDTDVTGNSVKVYRVRSVSNGIQSDWSEAVTVNEGIDKFGIPENLTVVVTGASIILNWDAVEGSSGYDIQVDGQIKDAGLDTTFTVTAVESETIHTLRVRIRNEDGVGEWSNAVRVEVPPAMPQIPGNLTARVCENSISLSWNPVLDASSYDLELDGSVIENVIGTTFIDNNLIPNSEYSYRIRSRNENGVSNWSNTINAATLSDVPTVPEQIGAAASKSTITLTWKANTSADSYEIDIDEKFIETTADTQYIHDGLDTDEKHTYKIRSGKGKEYSDWSEALIISTLPKEPSVPDGITVTTSGSSIIVKYNRVAEATGYDIQIDGNTVDNGNLTSFTKEEVHGTQHSVRVRAKNAGGISGWSVEANVLIPEETPGVPESITVKSGNKSVTLQWHTIEGTTGYDVEADGRIVSTGKLTEFKDEGLLTGTSHMYRIRANNEGGNGVWSSIITAITTLSIPENLAVSTSSGAIQLSWDAVQGASQYELEVDGKATKITGTTFIQDYAIPNQEYAYKVRAINQVTVSEWSADIKTKLPMHEFNGDFGKEEEFDFELGASNVKDINKVKFTIIYDQNQVELVDLYSNTQKADLSIGNIKDSNIKILQLIPGKIVLMLSDNEITGEYSGIVDNITFKAKESGQAKISYSMN